MDRNYLELLQELQVAQTGVQILFAFLLGVAFTPRFADLLAWQRLTYGVVLVLCALVGALGRALSLVLGPWSLVASAALGGLFVGVWYGLPPHDRTRHSGRGEKRY